MKYRTMASALIAVVVVLGVAVTGLGSASAGTAASPPPARDLLGVSCVTARNCLAVGIDYAALKGWGGPLAETWNGATWRTVGVKLPQGATAGVLRGVSCVSAGRCLAVGSYDKGPGRSFALASAWNGREWAPARLPAPVGANSSLSAVSCASGFITHSRPRAAAFLQRRQSMSSRRGLAFSSMATPCAIAASITLPASTR